MEQPKPSKKRISTGLGTAIILLEGILAVAILSSTLRAMAREVGSVSYAIERPLTVVKTDWKTHSSGVYAFSIQYPSDWFAEEDTGQAYKAIGKQVILTNYKPGSIAGRELAGSEAKYVVSVHDNPKKLTAQQYVDELKRDPNFSFGDNYKEVKTTVVGTPAVRIEMQGLGISHSTYVAGSNYVYLFTGFGSLGLYDDILSTLSDI